MKAFVKQIAEPRVGCIGILVVLVVHKGADIAAASYVGGFSKTDGRPLRSITYCCTFAADSAKLKVSVAAAEGNPASRLSKFLLSTISNSVFKVLSIT